MLPLVLALVALGAFIYVALVFARKASFHGVPEAPVQVQAAARPARPVNRMQAGMRRRRRGAARAGSGSDSEDEGGIAGEADGEDEGADQREAAPTRKDAYEARRAARDAEREAAEAAQEAEVQRAAQERAAREAAEAERWAAQFVVEAAGEEAEAAEQAEARSARMADYIRGRKAVALDELAAEFGLRGAEAPRRVAELEASGAITGVMDDRGKYIFISTQEMEAVADFIKARGRVSIAELAARSERLIDLAPVQQQRPAAELVF